MDHFPNFWGESKTYLKPQPGYLKLLTFLSMGKYSIHSEHLAAKNAVFLQEVVMFSVFLFEKKQIDLTVRCFLVGGFNPFETY